MRRRADAVFALLIAATVAWAAYEARQWPDDARLFPLAIALPALVLALAQVPLSLRASAPAIGGEEDEENLPDRERVRRTVASAFWILAFFGGVHLVGFEIAIAGGALLYLRLAAREGWLASVSVAAVCFALVSGVFGRGLHVPLPPGELIRLLGW